MSYIVPSHGEFVDLAMKVANNHQRLITVKARLDALESTLVDANRDTAQSSGPTETGSLVERVAEEIKNGMLETFNVDGDEWTTNRASIRAIRAVADELYGRGCKTASDWLLAELENK